MTNIYYSRRCIHCEEYYVVQLSLVSSTGNFAWEMSPEINNFHAEHHTRKTLRKLRDVTNKKKSRKNNKKRMMHDICVTRYESCNTNSEFGWDQGLRFLHRWVCLFICSSTQSVRYYKAQALLVGNVWVWISATILHSTIPLYPYFPVTLCRRAFLWSINIGQHVSSSKECGVSFVWDRMSTLWLPFALCS